LLQTLVPTLICPSSLYTISSMNFSTAFGVSVRSAHVRFSYVLRSILLLALFKQFLRFFVSWPFFRCAGPRKTARSSFHTFSSLAPCPSCQTTSIAATCNRRDAFLAVSSAQFRRPESRFCSFLPQAILTVFRSRSGVPCPSPPPHPIFPSDKMRGASNSIAQCMRPRVAVVFPHYGQSDAVPARLPPLSLSLFSSHIAPLSEFYSGPRYLEPRTLGSDPSAGGPGFLFLSFLRPAWPSFGTSETPLKAPPMPAPPPAPPPGRSFACRPSCP